MNDIPHPTIEEQNSIRSGVAWFRKTAIYNQGWIRTPEGRKLVPSAGEGPIWARYYQTGRDLPIFADRDKSIHDNVNELSEERRSGYQWFSSDARRVLERFKKWNHEHSEIK